MIGLGKWQGEVDTVVLSGSAIVTIYDKDGNYAFDVEIEGVKKLPKFSVYDIVEGEDSLFGKAKINVMGGIDAEISVKFIGEKKDRFEGHIKLPMLGIVPIKNGRRID